MDLHTFIQSLTQKEKLDLFLLLKKEFRPGEAETLREFFERQSEGDRLNQRLRSCFGYALHQLKEDPRHSCLNKAVNDVTYEDVYVWKGMGPKTWQEFVSLRGY